MATNRITNPIATKIPHGAKRPMIKSGSSASPVGGGNGAASVNVISTRIIPTGYVVVDVPHSKYNWKCSVSFVGSLNRMMGPIWEYSVHTPWLQIVESVSALIIVGVQKVHS